LVSRMTDASAPTIAVVGGGPAGLMAAEVARSAGFNVDVYEGKGSVGRKFLLAGKGGLNLTHSEGFEPFVARYGHRAQQIRSWLENFDNNAVRDWARGLGVDSIIGTSGRIFPVDLKAAPLLRSWVRRLRESGVHFHVHHYCTAISDKELTFRTPHGKATIRADAVVLALGGGSWPELGSDGRWVDWLCSRVDIAPLQPANCGFDVGWSEVFARRFAGHPLKTITVSTGGSPPLQGECVVTARGIEGSVIYALSTTIREAITSQGSAQIHIDLAPAKDEQRLIQQLSQPRGSRSLTEHVRRTVGIDGVKMGLLYEFVPRADMEETTKLAAAIKSLPVTLLRPRPIAEAISSAGGVRFDALDQQLMLKEMPGVFCAGEMIDWEAPTGGYLLNACFASGRIAGAGAARWLQQQQA
jgi:uncharacterized flavoprotein (TIGR03862 family)